MDTTPRFSGYKWIQPGYNSDTIGYKLYPKRESPRKKPRKSKKFRIQNVSKSGSDSESYRYHGYRVDTEKNIVY
jgi:hypothetical protein